MEGFSFHAVPPSTRGSSIWLFGNLRWKSEKTVTSFWAGAWVGQSHCCPGAGNGDQSRAGSARGKRQAAVTEDVLCVCACVCIYIHKSS